jgi:hypothetical protein
MRTQVDYPNNHPSNKDPERLKALIGEMFTTLNRLGYPANFVYDTDDADQLRDIIILLCIKIMVRSNNVYLKEMVNGVFDRVSVEDTITDLREWNEGYRPSWQYQPGIPKWVMAALLNYN